MFLEDVSTLVVVTIDRQPTRKRTAKRDFADDVQPVIDVLVKERLLSAEGEGEDSVISVAHEKLFGDWPRLEQWVAENREHLFVLRQAEIEAGEWERHGYDLRYLWHEDRLHKLQGILNRIGYEYISDLVRLYASPQDTLLKRLRIKSLPHQERLRIGQYLASLGDLRPGIGVRSDGVPDIEWITIPEGCIRLHGIEHVFKVKRFRIAKYPVTNMQFNAFIEDKGYETNVWWGGISRHKPMQPAWNELNCPRETVSWPEAVAFCRWLSERTGSRIRLPTEWEWRLAATGENPEREYPWPDGWDEERCNSEESHLGRTMAVGMYPSGATEHGVFDMVGNVWEWCLNTYNKPWERESLRLGTADRRAIQGGSWNENAISLAFRYESVEVLDSDIGFRLTEDI
jgi:hypothetical protein